MFRWLQFVLALSIASSALAGGSENFNNFPVTGSSYSNGTFLGQDGSIWTFVECQGNNLITPPRTPGLAKGTPFAYVVSGTIAGGCGNLSFDWRRLQTNCNFDILVNDVVRHTLTGGVKDVTNHVDSLAINVTGDFTLKFLQHDTRAGQVAIDNVAWTSYGGGFPEPPELLFTPDTNGFVTAYGNRVQLAVTATEPNEDVVSLWATGLPSGAGFSATTAISSAASAFSWTPAAAQTGSFAIVFFAGDKDGTNSRTFSIEVTPIYPYYHGTEGLTGAVLKAKLHDIISAGVLQLDNNGEDAAMKEIHTDPANTNNVLLLYNPTSSVPKSAYNDIWNKEHCWPESRGLSESGPDQVDVHNLYAEDILVNELRARLEYDESDPAAAVPGSSAETSMDSDSWEPPPASKGNVARAVFYMAVRYVDGAVGGWPLELSDTPDFTNQMGKLSTLLLWHALDPPDDWERTRNEIIYSTYQHNRNPFIDHPEWVEEIWGTDDDGDGATATHEIIAGSDPDDPNSVFRASLSGTQVVCGLLSSGSVWSLYQGVFAGNDIAWRPIAETNRLQDGTLRFDIAPTNPATFYHLRATRP